eukprot:m.554160 g.554160  ORF g.554160 m.554160 type:complete len:476 (+) comp22176_c0_seq2:671-2098(+)
MSSRQQSSKRPAQPQPWHRPKSSPMKIAQAEAALSADGQTPDGRFMVWHQPSGAAVLTMCYKGKCTHHKIAPNEDGILTMNKKTFGLNATKLGQIVSALSKEPLPKGWPMRLSETVDPSGKVLKHPAKKSTTPATGAGSTKGSSTKSVTAKVSGGAAPPRPEKRDTKKESSAPKGAVKPSTETTEIKVGNHVNVEEYGAGVVRFVGPHHTSGALRIGVELTEANGKNNGTVKGHEYFQCKAGHGVLVGPKRCAVVPGPTDNKKAKKRAKKDKKEDELAPMEGTKIEKPAIASADNSVAEARETVVQRQAESGSFGFTIAQEYRGYTAKWVTFVAAAESHSNLVSGDQVLSVETTVSDPASADHGQTVSVIVDSSEFGNHSKALALLRRAGDTVTLRTTTAPIKIVSVKPSVLPWKKSDSATRCGMSVWCACKKCQRRNRVDVEYRLGQLPAAELVSSTAPPSQSLDAPEPVTSGA